MDQITRPTPSTSPLRMHALNSTTKVPGVSTNYDQQKITKEPNQRDAKVSPIRESLIQNTGQFILGQKNNASNSNMAVGSSNLNTNDLNNNGLKQHRERSEETRLQNGNNSLHNSESNLQEKDVLDDFIRPNISLIPYQQ